MSAYDIKTSITISTTTTTTTTNITTTTTTTINFLINLSNF